MITWREGVQPLLCSYSNWFLLCAFVVIVVAKWIALSRITDASRGVVWIGVIVASDALLCFGLAAVCQMVERRVAWMAWFTSALAALVLVLSAVNAAYLILSGELLSWQSVSVGVARFDEVWGIVAESMSAVAWCVAAASCLVLVALPYSLRQRWKGTGSPSVCFSFAGIAVLAVLAAPAPNQIALAQLTDSAALAISGGYSEGESSSRGTGLFGSFPTAVPRDVITSWARRDARPNVLFFILESTRWDVTSLAGGPADTVTLSRLAERGLNFQSVRAVMPHTTKSLWSILCGQFPLMQVDLYETSVSAQGQCLPHILGAAGYRRAFIQSARGNFEDRPRLVANMGFEHFMAWEDIKGEPLGFLGSDDQSLTTPFLRFVDQEPSTPFVAVVLTSATHYPYRMPKDAVLRSRELQKPMASSWDRYVRLVESADMLLADVVSGLSARGLIDNTIIVALGDHGEGFGEQGVKQHDTNFFEEGLRVPLVIAGPGIEPRVTTQAASLLDLVPTILEGLELPYDASSLPGQSYLASDPPPSIKIFSCWFDTRCRGYVQGTRKVVHLPARRKAFAYDLARDPLEKKPHDLSSDDRVTLESVNQRITGLQSTTLPLVGGDLSVFGQWRCPRGEACAHPASPPGGFHGR